ncbi:predicted protein [Streptomyces albidoflavus]|nr:predicted protein [Streptomyces albidoflavus]
MIAPVQAVDVQFRRPSGRGVSPVPMTSLTLLADIVRSRSQSPD